VCVVIGHELIIRLWLCMAVHSCVSTGDKSALVSHNPSPLPLVDMVIEGVDV